MSRVKKIYSKLTEASNYVKPLRQDMDQFPYYNEQEQTYTDLTHLDTTHGEPTKQEKNDKMLVFPETEWNNPDWAGGDFLSPYSGDSHKMWYRTPNNQENYYDWWGHMGSSKKDIVDLGSRVASVVDSYLNSEKMFYKVSNVDIDQFFEVVAGSDDKLIHKSNKELWKMYKDSSGNLYIHRMFEDEILKD